MEVVWGNNNNISFINKFNYCGIVEINSNYGRLR